MPKDTQRFDPQKTGILADLRGRAGVSQQEAAKFFNLKNYDAVSDWELGYSRPPQTRHRQRFLVYLVNRLRLRADPPQFFAVWNSVMVETWEWASLTLEELHNLRLDPPNVVAPPQSANSPFLAPPRPPYPLIGRDALLQDLKQRLFARVPVALWGLPGVGKTALAIELANDDEVLERFYDGVLWARLGREANIFEELGRWAVALGMATNELAALRSIDERANAVHSMIGLRKLLLVIDDAWQLEAALAFQLGGPNCVRLFTTRLADIATHLAADNTVVVQELGTTEGLGLLKTLAQQAVRTAPDAARKLVKLVGGLPLALILVGNYLRSHTQRQPNEPIIAVIELLQQTAQRLRLAEPQAPVQRHPSLPRGASISLQAVIEVSYTSMEKTAQAMLCMLALFPPKPSTFSTEAALAVAIQPRETLSTLTRFGLVEQGGPDRYTLHQTIADYAGLGPIDVNAVARMVAFFVTYVQTHQPDHAALAAELSNIGAALDLAHRYHRDCDWVEAVLGLYTFAENRGLYDWIEVRLQRALVAARYHGDDERLARVLLLLGQMATQQEKHDQAERYAQEGLALAHTLGAPELIVQQSRSLGQLARVRGLFDQAEAYFQVGLAQARSLENPDIRVSLLSSLGAVAAERGAYSAAEAYLQEGLALAHAHNLRERACGLLNNLVMVTLEQGLYAATATYLEEGLQLAHATGHRFLLGLLLHNQGYLAQRQEQYAQAEASYQEALALQREVGNQEKISFTLQQLGEVALARNNYPQAEVYFQESLDLAQAIGNPLAMGGAYLDLGKLECKRQRWALATTYFQQCLAVGRTAGIQVYIAEALFDLAQMALAQGNHTQAIEDGQASLAIFAEIGHGMVANVRQWLAELPA